MKDIIYKLMEHFITYNFSNTFTFFLSCALKELHSRTPNVELTSLRGLIFVRLIGAALVNDLESRSAVEAESLKTVAIALQWFAEPSKEDESVSEDN
ncbi:hypothetical protein QTN25_003180 [Entamoeba marina]